MTQNKPQAADAANEQAACPAQGFVRGKAHYLPLRIYYADTDFSGIVYHGRYVEFMERGRTEALRALGITVAEGEEPPLFAVTKLCVHYKAPARIDDALLVETEIERLTGARFFIRQRIWKGAQMLTDGECALALLDSTGRPRRIPDPWRALCG